MATAPAARFHSKAWYLAWGEEVAVHTVCQHVFWERLLPLWQALGVSDLHLSHCEPKSAAIAAPYGVRVHSWPLAAANVVNADRREGLEPGRPLQARRRLASFVGAHMPHYRSEVRLRLRKEAARAPAPWPEPGGVQGPESGGVHGAADVVFELTDNWHYDAIVHREQVAGERLGEAECAAERAATRRYNELLSDSVFSLCPEGAGPNTLRLWESLAVGAIPVVVVSCCRRSTGSLALLWLRTAFSLLCGFRL